MDYPADIDSTGYVITGQSGTPLAGVTVLANSLLATDTSQTSTLVMTQGIMSELNNYLEGVIKEPVSPDRSDAGELVKKMDGLTTQNTDTQKRIDRINKMADSEVKRLEAQFQRVYAASLKYESILSMVNSLIAANSK
jgi:flagellar capping protein FliD